MRGINSLSLQKHVEFGVQFFLVLLKYCVTLYRLILVISEFVCVLGLEFGEELRELARTTIVLQLAHKSVMVLMKVSIGVGGVEIYLRDVGPQRILIELILAFFLLHLLLFVRFHY